MKFTILLLISFSVFANYIPEDEVGTGNSLTVFSRSEKCEAHYSKSCIRIPYGYNHEYHKLEDETEPDYDSPINSKNDIETCLDQADCESKNESKSCTDLQESVYMAQDYSEIYCSKVTGYNTKLTGSKIVVEDSGLKSSWQATKTANEQKEAGIAQAMKLRKCGERVMSLMLVRNSQKGLSTGQIKQLVKDQEDIERLLSAGSLDSAREEMLAVVADGTLVTDADKTALVAELDECK